MEIRLPSPPVPRAQPVLRGTQRIWCCDIFWVRSSAYTFTLCGMNAAPKKELKTGSAQWSQTQCQKQSDTSPPLMTGCWLVGERQRHLRREGQWCWDAVLPHHPEHLGSRDENSWFECSQWWNCRRDRDPEGQFPRWACQEEQQRSRWKHHSSKGPPRSPDQHVCWGWWASHNILPLDCWFRRVSLRARHHQSAVDLDPPTTLSCQFPRARTGVQYHHALPHLMNNAPTHLGQQIVYDREHPFLVDTAIIRTTNHQDDPVSEIQCNDPLPWCAIPLWIAIKPRCIERDQPLLALILHALLEVSVSCVLANKPVGDRVGWIHAAIDILHKASLLFCSNVPRRLSKGRWIFLDWILSKSSFHQIFPSTSGHDTSKVSLVGRPVHVGGA